MQLVEMFLEMFSWLFKVPSRWHWSWRWLTRLALVLALVLVAALALTPSAKS